MSKWISEFSPNVNGSFIAIVTYHRVGTNNGTIVPRRRYEYNTIRGWEGINDSATDKVVKIEWWDEFGIAENKKVIKLSFTKPQNREI